jgi:hypothetical protein
MPEDTIKMICDRLDRIEDKIDTMTLHGCAKAESHQDVEIRVRSLEADRSKALGVLSLLSLFAGAIGSFIYKILVAK